MASTAPFSRFEWMIAWRYLRARRSEGGVSVILRSDDYESAHYGLALAAAALAGGRMAEKLRLT